MVKSMCSSSILRCSAYLCGGVQLATFMIKQLVGIYDSFSKLIQSDITHLTLPFSIAVTSCEESNLKYGDATVGYFWRTY
jgi:hypothetical protein